LRPLGSIRSISIEIPWLLPELYSSLFFEGFGRSGALSMSILALLHVVQVPYEINAAATSALSAFKVLTNLVDNGSLCGQCGVLQST
jgi:hypothetical protein